MGLSNIYFWNESGYFNTASDFKPLLHTWSLGVEEQFYMIWPLVLVFLLRRLRNSIAMIFIVVAALFSLYLNYLFSDGYIYILDKYFPIISKWFSDGESTIFFLTPFRVFEFFIGAIVVWLIKYQPKKIPYLKY